MHYIHKRLIHHLSFGGWFKRMELIEVKSLIWAQKGKLYIIYENVMWIQCRCKFNYHTTTTVQVQLRWKVIVLLILMEFMIITVYNWFAESRFFVGVQKGKLYIIYENVMWIQWPTIPVWWQKKRYCSDMPNVVSANSIQWTPTKHWQTLSHNVLSSTPRQEWGSNSQLKWW
jgi:hypothetical protein